MKTLDNPYHAPEVDDDSMVIKSIPGSFIVYKDHRIMCDKKVSHYLLNLWVDYDRMKKDRITFLKRVTGFLVLIRTNICRITVLLGASRLFTN